ncbi:GAK5 protein, partial [Paradoxornis webbianus]|nr:GAK5 protein [Sinosuthora webbiana]
ANSECQKVLRPLKNPTIIEMVEACNRIGTVKLNFEAMAAAFAALKVAPGPTGQTCFGCGKPGHLKKDCHALKGAKLKKKNHLEFTRDAAKDS